MKKRKPAVFLDRDGTILTERYYLCDPKDIKYYPFVFKAMSLLQKAGFKLVIVTNQSGLARGYFSRRTLDLIHASFKKTMKKKGITISGIYFCPHLPDAGCKCRKPGTVLPTRAARELNLDLKKSFVVGDQIRDVLMAKRIGARGVLVLTGAGRGARKESLRNGAKVSSNLLTASQWIVSR